MKIAFIGLRMYPASYDGVSGIETRGEEIINYFSHKLNHKIFVFVRNWIDFKNNEHNKNINVIKILTLKNKYFDTLIYSFFASIKTIFLPADIVFYEGTGSFFFCFLPKLFGKKIIITIHTLEWKRKKWSFLGKIILKLFEIAGLIFADKIIVVSNELEEYIEKTYKRKTYYIPYFLEYKKAIAPNIIKNKYRLEGNDYILYLGRFEPEKRVDWLIKAYKQIDSKIKLVLAGGSSHSHKYVNNLYKIAKKNKKIIFTGFVFGKEKEELLSNCLFFVLPSELEGLSMALIDFLSYKKPFLVADILVHKRFINKSFLFKNFNYQNFVYKLKNFLDKKTVYKNFINRNNFATKSKFFHTYEKIVNDDK